jgi:hypothetical protein
MRLLAEEVLLSTLLELVSDLKLANGEIEETVWLLGKERAKLLSTNLAVRLESERANKQDEQERQKLKKVAEMALRTVASEHTRVAELEAASAEKKHSEMVSHLKAQAMAESAHQKAEIEANLSASLSAQLSHVQQMYSEMRGGLQGEIEWRRTEQLASQNDLQVQPSAVVESEPASQQHQQERAKLKAVAEVSACMLRPACAFQPQAHQHFARYMNDYQYHFPRVLILRCCCRWHFGRRRASGLAWLSWKQRAPRRSRECERCTLH